jgi:hypothetical protein
MKPCPICRGEAAANPDGVVGCRTCGVWASNVLSWDTLPRPVAITEADAEAVLTVYDAAVDDWNALNGKNYTTEQYDAAEAAVNATRVKVFEMLVRK